MRLTRRLKGFNTGQGMVEFALVLPLLLLLSLGIVEVGRLMVIYSSVSAASREAARYAAAAGKSAGGVPYYWDTAGIAAAARRVAILSGASSVIVSYYDNTNPGNLKTPTSYTDLVLGDQVRIQVSAPYTPLFGLVPLQAFNITAETTRTILKDVTISGNPPSGGATCSVSIANPGAGATFDVAQTIAFQATTSYTGTLTYVWSASPGGTMGSGQNLSYAFNTAGDYTVTVSACSPSASATVSIHIIAANAAPVVTITSPADGSAYDDGSATITFAATATDEDPNIVDNLIWRLDGSAQIGTGASFNYTMPVGTHTIIASVTDSGGKTGSASVSVIVYPLAPPVVTITSPSDGASFPTNTSINFTGTAIDRKGINQSANLVWRMDGGAPIYTGGSFNYTVPVGTHTISASYTDVGGTGTASITVNVIAANPPVVTILLPLNGASFYQGVNITFSGTARDPNNVNLTSSLKWYSNISGLIGSGGGPFSLSNLPVGTHIIRAVVTDPNTNISAEASVTITILANPAPTITILSPTANATYALGQTVYFTGTATDVPDGDISASLYWYSDLMGSGPIGTGRSFTRNNLIAGSHVITARVTDSGGLTASATRNITIIPNVCAALSGDTPVDLVENKGFLTWDLVNKGDNGTFSFTLIGVNLPWALSPAGQQLDSIDFGGNPLLASLPDTIPPTVINEGDWQNMGPNFNFPAPAAGGTLTRQLKFTFAKNLNGTITSGTRVSVIFKSNLLSTIQCTLTYQFP